MQDFISRIISFFTDKRNSLGKRITLGIIIITVVIGFIDDFAIYHHYKTSLLLDRIERVQKAKEAIKDKQSAAYTRIVEVENNVLNRTSFMYDLLSIYNSSLDKIQSKQEGVSVIDNELYGYLSTGKADSLYKVLSFNGLIVSSGSKNKLDSSDAIANIKAEDPTTISPLVNTLTTSTVLIIIILVLIMTAVYSLFSKGRDRISGFLGSLTAIFLTMLLVWGNQWFIGLFPQITHSLVYSNLIYQVIIILFILLSIIGMRAVNKKRYGSYSSEADSSKINDTE